MSAGSVKQVVIPISETDSSRIELRPGAGRGSFQIPAAFTGASVTIQGSIDGVTFTAVDSAVNVSAGGNYAIPAAAFSFKYIRFVSASSEVAARTIVLFEVI